MNEIRPLNIPPSLAAMTVAVTGANGFIGARVTEMLATLDFPPQVRLLSRRQTKDRKQTVVDLRDPLSVATGLKGCGAVIHCAFDFLDMAANLRIASVLASECVAIGARLIHVSTAAVHEPFTDGELDESRPPGGDGSDYKHIKLAIEDYLVGLVRDQGLDLVILQPTIVYGPFGRAWTDSPIRELLTGTVVLPNEGRGFCNAVFVDDVCQAIIAALTAPLASGERFLISGTVPVTWREFYGAYQDILGLDAIRLQPSDNQAPDEGTNEAEGRDLKTPSEPLPTNLTAARIDDLPAASNPVDRDRSALKSPALSRGKQLKSLVTKVIGSQASTQLNMWVSYLRSLILGGNVLLPTGGRYSLFRTRCHVRIDKARRLLSYEPRFDLEAGMKATAPYVSRTYGRLARLRPRGKAAASGLRNRDTV